MGSHATEKAGPYGSERLTVAIPECIRRLLLAARGRVFNPDPPLNPLLGGDFMGSPTTEKGGSVRVSVIRHGALPVVIVCVLTAEMHSVAVVRGPRPRIQS